MRVALIADIHGNLPALEAVLADLAQQAPDAVVNLGDHLSGPLWAAATADRLMREPWLHIRGNHDRQLLDRAPAQMGPSDQAAYAELHDGHKAWLAQLPATATAHGLYLCHGTPGSDTAYLLEEPGALLSPAPAIEGRLNGLQAPFIVCGHSHIPRVATLSSGQLAVNPGSAGLPAYDAGDHYMECGSPHARYALFDTATRAVDLRAIEYDWSSAAERAAARDRPDWACALRTGYALRASLPPSER